VTRTALVTGGASGIGAACAALLAEQGWSVEIADLDPGPGDHALGRRLDRLLTHLPRPATRGRGHRGYSSAW
jgi:NAD(P)-dependent dehydrogenase (short-subunit alcohol dehydrogenase family)